MKKILLVFLLFYVLSDEAQSFQNWAYHNDNQLAYPSIIEIYGDLYISTQRLGASLNGFSHVYRHGMNGNKKFVSSVLGFGTVRQIYKSNDNNLIVTTWDSYCDYVLSYQNNSLVKIDTTGNVVFNSTFPTKPGDFSNCSLQAPDSSFYTFTDSLAFHHSKTGSLLSKVNLGLTRISSAIFSQNGDIILSAKKQGQNTIVSYSSVTGIGSPTSTPVLLKKLCYYGGGGLLGLGSDGKIYKFSTMLSCIGNSTFVCNDFVVKNDSIYGVGSVNFFVADTSFNLLSSSTTTTTNFQQYAISLVGSNVIILGAGSTPQNYSPSTRNVYFSSLSVMSKLSSNNFSSDVAITGLFADSSYIDSSYPYACLRAKVIVKNAGVVPVEKFTLNCAEFMGMGCGHHGYQEVFDSLNLLPGDSITVLTNRFVRRYIYPGSNLNFCFFTTIPNGQTDGVYENNQMCFDFEKVSSIAENEPGKNSVSLYPNPSENDFTINSSALINSLETYDILGGLIKEEAVSAYEHKTGATMKPGVYFLKIMTDKGPVTKKVLKN